MSAQANAVAGMQAALAAANTTIKDKLLQSVRKAAQQKPEITTDDVWNQFERDHEVDHLFGGFDKSVIGPVMVFAVKSKILSRKQGFSLSSARPSTHGRLLRVFNSLVYEAA